MEKMNEIALVQCDVTTLTDEVLREARQVIVPKIKKICGQVDKETKKRITKNGDCAGLKFHEENGGVNITDIEGFYKRYSDVLTPQEYKSCLTVNLTAFRKIAVDRIQQEILAEQGGKKAKSEIETEIRFTALAYGEEKKKQIIL